MDSWPRSEGHFAGLAARHHQLTLLPVLASTPPAEGQEVPSYQLHSKILGKDTQGWAFGGLPSQHTP